MVTALETANLANDDDTGKHVMRVGEYAQLLAEEYGCDNDYCRRIRLYAPLHDVGKVSIPDYILKKPGKYTPEEFERMKEHVAIGGKMLSYKGIDPMAHNIALYHHEKWDGSGYLGKLSGEKIPLEARITGLADVYDALTKKRVYKPAFTENETDEIIQINKGSHFDPKLVDIFFTSKDKILEIKKTFSDE